MKKYMWILAFSMIVAITLLGLNFFQKRVSPIHADNIEFMVVVMVTGAGQVPYNCSPEQIRTFTEAFNQARYYRNDIGTTPPARVDVTFKDGTQLVVWGYNQGFATLKPANGIQQNIRGIALQDWYLQTMQSLM